VKGRYRFYDFENPREFFNQWHPVYDEIYKEFIIALCSKLEPIKFNRNKILYEELEQVTHVLLFEQGVFDVGYAVNGVTIYGLRYKNMVTDEKEQGL
jgi:hypothetical protein